jgi:hypothetical protein
MTDLQSRPRAGTALTHFYPELHHQEPCGHSLAHAVELAAQSFDDKSLTSVTSCEDGLLVDSRSLLALLSCCYARQTYRSADVAAAIRNDPEFRLSCLGASPDARTIRRFRRKNRAALHSCLMAGLCFLAAQKVEAGLVSKVCEASLEDEARRRIIMAMFIDSMELDRDQTTDAPTDLCYLFAKGGSRVH